MSVLDVPCAVPAQAAREYWQALSAGDTASAVGIALTLQSAGVPLPALLEDLVCAAQIEVGRRWAAAEWSVAHEHRATSISEKVVIALSAACPEPFDGSSGRVIVTCADGEWHALPTRVLAAALQAANWDVTFLGASVPARHLAQLLQDIGPDVVALSCSVPTRMRHARQMIEMCCSLGVPVIVGGSGFGPQGRWGRRLGAHGWAPDASSAPAVLAGPAFPSFADPVAPLRRPDDDAERLAAARDAVTVEVSRRLARNSERADAGSERRARVHDDITSVVAFLDAALYVDDVELFTGFVTWFTELLAARRVPVDSVTDALAVLDDVVAGRLPGLARAHAMIAAGVLIASAPARS